MSARIYNAIAAMILIVVIFSRFSFLSYGSIMVVFLDQIIWLSLLLS